MSKLLGTVRALRFVPDKSETYDVPEVLRVLTSEAGVEVHAVHDVLLLSPHLARSLAAMLVEAACEREAAEATEKRHDESR